MTTDFQIISGATVPENYYWDIGNPLETTPTYTVADSTTEYISGYAPGLKVTFKSDIQDLIYAGFPNVSSTYIWDFGDFYNSVHNTIVLPCVSSTVEHTYLLPGKYSVSLTNIQSKENQPPEIAIADPIDYGPCAGKYNIGWQWDNLDCNDTQQTTWNEIKCTPSLTATRKLPKTWYKEGTCFQKHCKDWVWKELATTGKNSVFWYETYRFSNYNKRWGYEVNTDICTLEPEVPVATIDTTEQIALKQFIVEVKEILPIANIQNETSPLTGYSPYPLKLSPKKTKTGSFPIDRIDWDPNDGSGIKTVTRYATPDSKYFTYNNAYFSDPQDPRNYDFTYTIIRNADAHPVFYPSLTCYSASTNSTDSCSVIVGPILLEPQKQDIQLLKTKSALKADFYGIEINKNITILSTLTGSEPGTNKTSRVPNAPVRQITSTEPIIYFGNTGDAYLPEYNPGCEYIPSEASLEYLLFEDLATNLFTYSEQFDDSIWVKTNTTITPDTYIAPNGSQTADKLYENTAGPGNYNMHQKFNTTQNAPYTFSVFLKAAERDLIMLEFVNVDSVSPIATGAFFFASGSSLPETIQIAGYKAVFDLTKGYISARGIHLDAAEMVSIGNGWYRCSITATANNTSINQEAKISLMTSLSGDPEAYTGTTNYGALVWGAQLEENSYSPGYVATTSTPVTAGVPMPMTLEDLTLLYK